MSTEFTKLTFLRYFCVRKVFGWWAWWSITFSRITEFVTPFNFSFFVVNFKIYRHSIMYFPLSFCIACPSLQISCLEKFALFSKKSVETTLFSMTTTIDIYLLMLCCGGDKEIRGKCWLSRGLVLYWVNIFLKSSTFDKDRHAAVDASDLFQSMFHWLAMGRFQKERSDNEIGSKFCFSQKRWNGAKWNVLW